jgi:hypothetical protein
LWNCGYYKHYIFNVYKLVNSEFSYILNSTALSFPYIYTSTVPPPGGCCHGLGYMRKVLWPTAYGHVSFAMHLVTKNRRDHKVWLKLLHYSLSSFFKFYQWIYLKYPSFHPYLCDKIFSYLKLQIYCLSWNKKTGERKMWETLVFRNKPKQFCKCAWVVQ